MVMFKTCCDGERRVDQAIEKVQATSSLLNVRTLPRNAPTSPGASRSRLQPVGLWGCSTPPPGCRSRGTIPSINPTRRRCARPKASGCGLGSDNAQYANSLGYLPACPTCHHSHQFFTCSTHLSFHRDLRAFVFITFTIRLIYS